MFSLVSEKVLRGSQAKSVDSVPSSLLSRRPQVHSGSSRIGVQGTKRQKIMAQAVVQQSQQQQQTVNPTTPTLAPGDCTTGNIYCIIDPTRHHHHHHHHRLHRYHHHLHHSLFHHQFTLLLWPSSSALAMSELQWDKHTSFNAMSTQKLILTETLKWQIQSD